MHWIIFAIVAIVLLIGLGIGYIVRISKTTSDVIRHEVKHGVAARDILHAVMFAGVFIIWVGLFALLPDSWRERALASLSLLASVGFWAYIVILPWRKRQAGSVLLHLGRFTSHKSILVVGGIWALCGIGSLVFGLSESNAGLKEVFYGLFWLSGAACFFSVGLSRSEIRERGILYLGRFVKWKRVESFKWEGKNDHTLTIWLRKRLLSFRTISLSIPSVHKDAVDSLLAQHISGAASEVRNDT